MRARALVLLLAMSSCTTPPPADPMEPGSATIVSIIDGDTVVLDLAGVTERVRLLGIDTPETSHPTRPVECFGAEASTYLEALVPPGSQVRVERDIEIRDHFGRLLLYLYRSSDDLFVNHAMVAAGYATTLHIEPNGTHRTALSEAERRARAAGLGLWGTCGGPGVPIDPLTTG